MPNTDVGRQRANGIFGVDFEIFVLGVVSFLTDLSSEMIFSVLAIFLSAILGASAFKKALGGRGSN